MTQGQSAAAKRRYQQEAAVICSACEGTGLVANQTITARSRKGGMQSYRRSLESGQLSMSERGKRGGRPEEPSLDYLIAKGRGARA